MADVHEIAKLLVPALLPDEQRIFREIEFRYPDNPRQFASPHAFKARDGRRVVVFETGFYRTILAVGDLNMINRAKGGVSPIPDYMRYAIGTMFENRFRPVDRQEKIVWPVEWVGISEEEYLTMSKDKDLGLIKTGTILGTVAFIYAHEIAHHVLGHTDSAPSSLQESRRRETEADEWACERLIKAGLLPLGGMYGAMLFYFFDESAIAHEELRTHPADLRRIRNVIAKSIASIERFRERAGAVGEDFDAIKRDLQKLLDGVNADIERQEKSGRRGPPIGSKGSAGSTTGQGRPVAP